MLIVNRLKHLASILQGLAVVACGFVPTPGRAEETAATYPSRNVTLVYAYSAGGPGDVGARLLAPYLSTALGKQVIVENRAGASGTIGARSVARASPDGLTLMLTDISLTITFNQVPNAGYDPRTDFAPIAPVLRSFMMLVVHPDVPAKSVKEIVALAKAKPGELKFGTSGVGSPPHLGALAFMEATGTNMLHVPYRGVSQALNDAMAGHLSLVFSSEGSAGPMVAAGKLRALGIFGDKRARANPSVPTFKEQGLDTRVADQGTWFGIVTTKGTPNEIIKKLNLAVNGALKDPNTKAALEKAGFDITGGTPEDLKAMIDGNVIYWNDILKKAGAK